jgi:hypothetical protein
MTSFTRKLHKLDPSAAKAIHRQQYGDYRYGRHVTLAQFAMPEKGRQVPARIEGEWNVAERLQRWSDRGWK